VRPFIRFLTVMIASIVELGRGSGRGAYLAFSLIWFAGVIELIAGALLLLGLFTRIAAFILSGELAFAYFIGHAPKGFYPLTNGGESAVLFCFIFLYLAAAGGGAWSLDALRGKA
jgi:putative oxidoreductase